MRKYFFVEIENSEMKNSLSMTENTHFIFNIQDNFGLGETLGLWLNLSKGYGWEQS